MIFERMSREGPQRYPAPPQPPQWFRLTGGSAALVRALAASLPVDRLILNAAVSAIAQNGARVRLTLPEGEVTADHVIAGLKPETVRLWQDTPTRMAPNAKVFALYDRPFWREAGLSGTAQSMVGPMPEIHDACTADGQAALFGFLGVGPADRARLGTEALTSACLRQLARLFGPEAASPGATPIKDRAADPLTAVPLDISEPGHPEPVACWVHGTWSDGLIMAGSEAAFREPGYLAGAVAASVKAVETVSAKVRS